MGIIFSVCVFGMIVVLVLICSRCFILLEYVAFIEFCDFESVLIWACSSCIRFSGF